MNANYDKYNNVVGPRVRAEGQGRQDHSSVGGAVTPSGCATQFFTHEFQYQAALGAHFPHLYAPWSIPYWASKWHDVYPETLRRAVSVGILPTGLGLMALVFAKMVLANSLRRSPYLHGSANWANRRDIQLSGLLPRPRFSGT